MIKTLKQKLAIGTLCLLTAGAGFYAGKEHSRVDHITFAQAGGLSGFKVIRLHKPFSEDQVFSKRNSYFHWEAQDANGKYIPMRGNVENSYGDGSKFSEMTIKGLYSVVGLKEEGEK